MSAAPARSAPSAAFTDADRSLLVSLGQRQAASAAGTADSVDRQARFRSRYRESLGTAAFLGEFDPTVLLPGIGEADLQLLLRDCTVSSNGNVTRWRLTASARGRLLAELIRDAEVERYIAAAAAYSHSTSEPPDAFSQALVALCRGAFPTRHDLAAAGIETWSAYRAALAALKGAGIPDARRADAILADVSHAELMEPFRFLTGWKPSAPPPRHAADAVYGEDAFVGRRDKLTLLRSFVDVLESQGYLESFQRGVKRLRGSDSRTMILSGIGGVGKSTLVAKFILDHVAKEPGRIWFAYLDFDRSTINPAQPGTLLLEIVRQLRWQIPAIGQELDNLRERLRTDMRAWNANGESPSSAGGDDEAPGGEPGDARLPPELIPSSSLRRYLIEVNDLVWRAGRTEQATILLVLDTFEEVQTLGDEAVERVERMVSAMEMTNGVWRTLIVGRDAATGFFDFAQRELLEEFEDQASRSAFLEARGVPPALSARVARIAGGRPLALLLAARLVREHGMDAIEVSVFQRMTSLFRERLIEGVLYQRILGHIVDTGVRQIAHPGLVLRWIDADVIASVIVPVLGLSGFDAKKIQQVMAAFRRQKDLVRVEPDGSVVHRSDVRVQMLELLEAEDPDMVRRLHRAAVDYYVERQRHVPAEQRQRLRIEELYHRLRLGTELDLVVQRWIAPARSALARTAAEITSEEGRLALNILLGRLPSLDQGRKLPPLLAQELVVRTVKAGLAYHAPEKALEALELSPSRLTPEFTDFHRPLALDRTGNWYAASRGYVELTRYASRKHLLAAADFFERFPENRYWNSSGVTAQLCEALFALPQRSADIELALARLHRRIHRGNVISGMELPRCSAFLPITGTASTKTQWLLTLTDNIERHGLAVFDGMPVTDPMRRQLVFLTMLLDRSVMQRFDPQLVECCRVLLESRSIGARANERQAAFADARPWPLLRHIMRPATPQWYVPLAATLRLSLGGSVDTGAFFARAKLPPLPEPPPLRLNTTRALAELFAQVDQLGMLLPVLRGMQEHWFASRDEPFTALLEAYGSWRADMFPTLDPWLDSLIGAATDMQKFQ